MNKRFLAIAFLYILMLKVNCVLAQKSNKPDSRWMVAWQPGFMKIKTYPFYPIEETYDILLLESYLDIGYSINKNFMIGGRAGYGFKASGNLLPDFPETYHLGYFIRYYPYEGEKRLGKERNVCEKCVNFRLRPYFQLFHYFTNFQIKDGENIGLNHLGVQELGGIIGISIRLRKNLFYNTGSGMRYTKNSDINFSKTFNNSIEYHFGYTKNKANQNNPECNSTWVGGIGTCITKALKKKEPKPNKIIIGSSLTYISDKSYNVDSILGNYNEYSWNINATTFLSRRLRAGLNTIQIFSKDPVYGKNKYFLAGPMIQYEPFLAKRNPIMFEAGFMYGNYCTCDPGDPQRKSGLFYRNLGITYQHRLAKNLYLDLGFNDYSILNNIKFKYHYTQYIVGLNYAIDIK